MGNIHVKLYKILTSGSGGDFVPKYFSSTALETISWAVQNHLCNFGRGHYEKHFCETAFN